MSAGISLGTIASIVGIAGGIKALTSSGGGSAATTPVSSGGTGATAVAQQVVDPFVKYRDTLGGLYASALTQGGTEDITKMPGYSQFRTGVMDPSLEASKRSAAASGMMRSGNEQIALDKQSQQGYYGFMTDYMNRLATASGATTLPQQSSALQAGQQQQQAQMQGFGGIVQGLGGLYNSSSPYVPNQTASVYGQTSGSWDGTQVTLF
jgi:hypothetical protein